MKYYIKIWIAETVLHFVNGRCCLLLYTIGKTQKTNNQGSEKVKVSWRHCLPSWFFKTRLFPKVRIFFLKTHDKSYSFLYAFLWGTDRQTDRQTVCMSSACLCICLCVCVSVSVCLPVHVVSSLNCLRDLELSSIQNGTDGAFSEPCKK